MKKNLVIILLLSFAFTAKAENLYIPSKERRTKDNVNISLSRFSAHLTIGLRL